MLNAKVTSTAVLGRIDRSQAFVMKAKPATDTQQKLTLYLEALDMLYAIDKNAPDNYRTLAYRAFAYLIENFGLDWDFLYLIRDAYELRASDTPGDKMCSHNFFSKRFKVIKDRIELSMDYTIYGFKHSLIVHEMMKGTDGYMISHMARHIDRKSTEDYKRDYDITLVNVYNAEDLVF